MENRPAPGLRGVGGVARQRREPLDNADGQRAEASVITGEGVVYEMIAAGSRPAGGHRLTERADQRDARPGGDDNSRRSRRIEGTTPRRTTNYLRQSRGSRSLAQGWPNSAAIRGGRVSFPRREALRTPQLLHSPEIQSSPVFGSRVEGLEIGVSGAIAPRMARFVRRKALSNKGEMVDATGIEPVTPSV